ncbi:MAG: hypothetical protein KC503_24930 [Myxococcales bacterium]|nr:hypothetical protein [Myxococcales bacterium]
MKAWKRLPVALFALAAFGCASGTVYRRGDAPKIDYSKEKFIVMPVDIHGLPGDKLKYSAALFGGIIGASGGNGISLQPIKPVLEAAGMGNLSWKLAHGTYHMVSVHHIYDFKKDTDQSELATYPEMAAKLVGKAAEALKLNFKPRFVLSAHIDGMGKGSLPGTYKYRVIASLYDTKVGMVHAATYYVKTTAEKALLAEMATLGKQVFAILKKADDEAK